MTKKKAQSSAKKSASEFNQKCYDILKKVPPGSVTTYGDLARKMGTKAFRAVGRAMNKNPFAPVVPCHRVVTSDGRIGGYAFGVEKKIKILQKEGVQVRNGKIVDFEKHLHRFK